MFRFSKSLGWKKSKAHLLLLSKFIRGQEVGYFVKGDNWETVLNESAQKAVQRFIDEGMLINADLDAVVSYKYKVGELKDLLKQRRLAVSGTKDELVQRLIQADREGTIKSVSGMTLLTCSQAGREISEQYIASEKEKRTKVEHQVIDYLAKRMFKEASLAVANYEAEQVFSRGIGIGWKHCNPNHDIEMLKTIFESKPPKIIARLGKEKLEAVRIAAAMMALWGENKAKKWLPSDFETSLPFDNDTVVRMINFQAVHRATLERYHSEELEYVEILPASDSCEACRKLAGKRYKPNEAPELPNEHCTYEMGCRCVYLPCVD